MFPSGFLSISTDRSSCSVVLNLDAVRSNVDTLVLCRIPFSRLSETTGTTQLNCSLLIVSVIAILLPAAFHQVVGGDIPVDEEAVAVLSFSRGVRDRCHSLHDRQICILLA